MSRTIGTILRRLPVVAERAEGESHAEESTLLLSSPRDYQLKGQRASPSSAGNSRLLLRLGDRKEGDDAVSGIFRRRRRVIGTGLGHARAPRRRG